MTSPLLTVPTLRTMLADTVTNWSRLGAPALCERFVLRNGWVLKGRKLPKSYERGPPKNCFQNAADLAARNRTRLRYVEGYAMRNRLLFPTLHAWCIDSKDRVIDPTWDDPQHCQYMGIPMTAHECWDEMKRTGVYGLIDPGMVNYEWMFRLDPGLKDEVEAVVGKVNLPG